MREKTLKRLFYIVNGGKSMIVIINKNGRPHNVNVKAVELDGKTIFLKSLGKTFILDFPNGATALETHKIIVESKQTGRSSIDLSGQMYNTLS